MILCTKSDCISAGKCISYPPKIVTDRWLKDPLLQLMDGCTMYTKINLDTVNK